MSLIGSIKATKEAMMWIATISMFFGVMIIGFALCLIATIRPTAPMIVCTQVAKVCPDGSGVGRIGSNCEFAACPGVNECAAGVMPSCTKDLRELCSPDGIFRRSVAGTCSCGEDAATLERLGWRACTSDAELIFNRTEEEICGTQPPVDCEFGKSLQCDRESGLWSCLSETTSVDTRTWKTYRNEQYGFEVKYPQEWSKLPFEEHSVEQYNGLPLYGRGSCETKVLGVYEWGAYFSHAEDEASYLSIGMSNFSDSPRFYIEDGLGDPREYNILNFEKALSGKGVREDELPRSRYEKKVIDDHYAFYTDRPFQFGGPCDFTPTESRKLRYGSYEFLKNGRYISIEISTDEKQAAVFDSVLSTIHFLE